MTKIIRTALALSLSFIGVTKAQTVTRYGDAVLVNSPSLSGTIQDKSVRLNSMDSRLGLYIFCVDSRTPNVSVYFKNGSFSDYGYSNGAQIPVSWQADNRAIYKEYWHVIGQSDDLRRYGPLGLITAELFKTNERFKLKLLDDSFVFPARGVNEAMKNLSCVIPFLKSTHYIK